MKLDATDLRAIADATPPPWRDLLRLLLETGARYQEIATLTAAQVDPDGLRIEPHALPDGALWRPKRPSSVRKIRLPQHPELLARLARTPGLVLFPGRDRPLTVRSANRALATAARTLGMPRPTTHDFRRARITQALAAGCDPNVVRATVGHRSLVTTVQYLRDVPVAGTLPSLDAAAADNPAAAQYLNLVRSGQWRQ